MQRLSLQKALQNKLITNFISLGSLQAFNFLVPLVLTPYLIKTLGVENFGKLSLAQAVITYFTILTDFGLSLSATKEVAVNKHNSSQIQALFSAVITTKIILTATGFVLLYLGLLIFSADDETQLLFLLSYSMVVGQAFLPLWLFQGMEDMKYITYLSILTRITSLLLIFLFIKEQQDYVYLNLLNGAGTLLAAFLGLVLIKTKFNLRLKAASLSAAFNQIREGWHIFISNVVVNIYMTSNLIILGIFASKEIVGTYSVAEKVTNAVRQTLPVFYQATYPRVCYLISESPKAILKFYKKVHIPFMIGLVVFCGLLYLGTNEIILYFTGSYDAQISWLMRMLIVTPVIVALNIPANQLLLAYNHKKMYSRTLVGGSVLNIMLNLILSQRYLAKGTAISVVLTEIVITALLYLTLFKKLSVQKNLNPQPFRK